MAMPIMEGIKSVDDMPHPISYAVAYRQRIESYKELPEDKQPPRDLWNKPHKLDQWFDDVFDRKSDEGKKYIDINEWEVE